VQLPEAVTVWCLATRKSYCDRTGKKGQQTKSPYAADGSGWAVDKEHGYNQLSKRNDNRKRPDEARGGSELADRCAGSRGVGELGDSRHHENGGDDQAGCQTAWAEGAR